MYCLHFKIMSMQKVIFRVYAVSFGEGGGLAPSMD